MRNPVDHPLQNSQTLQQYLQQAPHWEERYRRLLQLTTQVELEPPPRTAAHRVSGCTARVWLMATGAAGQMYFRYAADSRLVNALLLVLLQPVQGQAAADIARFDFAGWLASCGLTQHLTPSRANGIAAVSRTVRELALSWQESPA